MKKIFAIILCAVMVAAILTGCSEVEDKSDNSNPSIFVKVGEDNLFDVVYHRETKVMYVISRGSYNGGNFVLLVNADGSPMVWEEQDDG